jgi:hypothetical protein
VQPCSHRRREQHRRGTHHNGQVPASSASLPLALHYTLTIIAMAATRYGRHTLAAIATRRHTRCHGHTPPHMTASISHHAQCRHTLAAIATRRYTLTAIATHCPPHGRLWRHATRSRPSLYAVTRSLSSPCTATWPHRAPCYNHSRDYTPPRARPSPHAAALSLPSPHAATWPPPAPR